jgi:hypothetical protein
MAYVYEEQKLRRLLVAWPPPLASTFALPSDPNMGAFSLCCYSGPAERIESPVDGLLPSATRSIPAHQKRFLFRFCSLMIFFHLFCSARRARASCFNAR